jgi:hypothetical protein
MGRVVVPLLLHARRGGSKECGGTRILAPGRDREWHAQSPPQGEFAAELVSARTWACHPPKQHFAGRNRKTPGLRRGLFVVFEFVVGDGRLATLRRFGAWLAGGRGDFHRGVGERVQVGCLTAVAGPLAAPSAERQEHPDDELRCPSHGCLGVLKKPPACAGGYLEISVLPYSLSPTAYRLH